MTDTNPVSLMNSQAVKKHDIYYISCFLFCGLYFARDIMGFRVTYSVIYCFVALSVLVFSREETISFILSMLAFQNAGYSGIFAIIILVTVVIKFNNSIRFAKTPFILIILLSLYEVAHYFYPGGAATGEYITYICLFLSIGILLQYDFLNIDRRFLVKSYFIFSLFFSLMTFIQMLNSYGSLHSLMQFGFRGEEYGLLVKQTGHLIANQNYLTVLCSVNLGIGSLMITREKNRKIYILGVGCFIFVGLLTVSKMFVIILVGYFLYLMIAAFRKSTEYGFLTAILGATVAFAIYSLFDQNLLALVRYRFSSGDISTGRIDIIHQLLAFMANNKYTYFWGTGLLNLQYQLGVAVHNSIFEIIGGWGIIGSIIPVILTKKMINDIKNKRGYKKTKFGLNALPLMITLLYSLTGMLFSSPTGIARLVVCIYALGIDIEYGENNA